AQIPISAPCAAVFVLQFFVSSCCSHAVVDLRSTNCGSKPPSRFKTDSTLSQQAKLQPVVSLLTAGTSIIRKRSNRSMPPSLPPTFYFHFPFAVIPCMLADSSIEPQTTYSP